jgi:hypothetical protein
VRTLLRDVRAQADAMHTGPRRARSKAALRVRPARRPPAD